MSLGVESVATGIELKRAGQQLALDFSGSWAEEVVMEFRGWAAIEKARGLERTTIERFRVTARHQPPSHKAWGALPRLLVEAGLIEPVLDDTGQPVYRRAASPKTHAHPVRLWRLR